MTSSSQTLNIIYTDVKVAEEEGRKDERKNLRSTAEEQRCLTSNFIKGNHLWLFIDPFSVLIGRRHFHLKFLLVASSVELLGRCFVIGCCGKFGVPQVIATFILLLHTVGNEKEEENSKEESNHSTCYHRWKGHKERLI